MNGMRVGPGIAVSPGGALAMSWPPPTGLRQGQFKSLRPLRGWTVCRPFLLPMFLVSSIQTLSATNISGDDRMLYVDGEFPSALEGALG